MKTVVSWIIGAALGATAAALLVAIFSPVSGQDVMRRLKTGYTEALQEARKASQERRVELEAELKGMQKRSKSESVTPQLPAGKKK